MNPVQRRRVIAVVVSLIVVGGVIVLGVRTVGRFVPRFVGEATEWTRGHLDEADAVSVPFELPAGASFQEISIVGGWRITIGAGEPGVAVTAAGRSSPEARVSVQHGTLHLEAPLTPGVSETHLVATVSMPELSRLAITGGADVRIEGVEADRLELTVDGAASVRADESRFEHLQVTVQGATNLDFRGSRTVNAHVELDGASNLSIRMDGGRLTGTLRGVGNVTWTGTASDEAIRVEGIGRVREQ